MALGIYDAGSCVSSVLCMNRAYILAIVQWEARNKVIGRRGAASDRATVGCPHAVAPSPGPRVEAKTSL